MKKYIIDGYLGIMPLDLTNVEPKYHRIMINEHNKDIEEYKLEQEKCSRNHTACGENGSSIRLF